MGRRSENNFISRDAVQAIKYYSHNNLTEFFNRHHDMLNMGRSTFHRILAGESSSYENVVSIEDICTRLGIMDPGGGSTYYIYAKTIRNLIYNTSRLLSDEVIKELDRPAINDFRTFIRENRTLFLKMMK